MAAAELGGHDPGRPGPANPGGLHSFQPGQTRTREAGGALPSLIFSSLRPLRLALPRLGGRSRNAKRWEIRGMIPDSAVLHPGYFTGLTCGAIRCAIAPYSLHLFTFLLSAAPAWRQRASRLRRRYPSAGD